MSGDFVGTPEELALAFECASDEVKRESFSPNAEAFGDTMPLHLRFHHPYDKFA